MERNTFVKICLTATTIGAAFGISCYGAGKALKPKQNVILILVDDQGYGDLSCNGNPIVRTPNLDRLAAESVSFTNFHAEPWCAPTRSSLMTGRYSHRVGGWETILGRNMLRDGEVTIADVFKNNSYATGIFGKWHLGTNYPYRPMDRGFDEWLGKGDGGTGCVTDYWGNDRVNDVFIHNGDTLSLPGYETDVFFDATKNFINKNKKQPFFIYLAPYAAHEPEAIPDLDWLKPFSEKVTPDVADFYAMINNIDKNVGKLRKYLQDEGLDKNTIVVYMSDNGSSRNAFPLGMRGSKGNEYDGGHRVPCFIHFPGGDISPKKVDRLTAHLDILPTFIDFCSLKLPKEVKFDGTSLRPILMDKEQKFPNRTLVIGTMLKNKPLPRPKWEKTSVMRENWRLINGKELYDIDTDPGQQKDIASAKPEIIEQLKADYEVYWKSVNDETQEWLLTQGRPILGTEFQPELNLCCEDWVSEDCPYNQTYVAAGVKYFGFWRIRVQKSGKYRVEVRRWPREANATITGVPAHTKNTPDSWFHGKPITWLLYGDKEPIAMPVAQIKLTVNDKSQSKSVGSDDKESVFEIELPVGEAKIEARMIDKSGNDLAGAYYVYVRTVN